MMFEQVRGVYKWTIRLHHKHSIFFSLYFFFFLLFFPQFSYFLSMRFSFLLIFSPSCTAVRRLLTHAGQCKLTFFFFPATQLLYKERKRDMITDTSFHREKKRDMILLSIERKRETWSLIVPLFNYVLLPFYSLSSSGYFIFPFSPAAFLFSILPSSCVSFLVGNYRERQREFFLDFPGK